MLSVRGGAGDGEKAVGASQFVEGSQEHQEKQRNSQQPEDSPRGQRTVPEDSIGQGT